MDATPTAGEASEEVDMLGPEQPNGDSLTTPHAINGTLPAQQDGFGEATSFDDDSTVDDSSAIGMV